ncbi:MAG: MBL fold metallo-hydrolase [Planctomycetes bacterium]|nr:MBL fold metallo-hydrolase [Planctomycetota bacterium]
MKLGDFEIEPAGDGPFKLDGGSLFGIVPKPLWSKLVKCDERNRVTLSMSCMVVRAPAGVVLVECGTGRKHNAKMRKIYGMSDNIHLVKSLGGMGLHPEDISAVILTHFHHDHCGSCTRLVDDEFREKKDKVAHAVPTFPKARYFVQRGEWQAATNPNPATKGTYLPENFVPLERAGQLELLDGDCEPIPGFRVRVTGGHTDHHQAIIAESDGQGIIFIGDIAPIVPCMRPAYNTAFDHHPMDTMRAKAELLALAIRNNWLVWFYHDAEITAARIAQGDDQPQVSSVEISAPDLGEP